MMLYHRLTLLTRRFHGHSLKPQHLFSLHSQTPTQRPLLEMPPQRYIGTATEVGPQAAADERLRPLSAVKVFASHSIYKGKAALTVVPLHPQFSPLDMFSLSVTELGTLISLGVTESCEFFHDPYKGKSDEGKVRKVLKVEPLPNGSGHFFNLSVQNKLVNVDESIYIPITKAEYTVLTSAFSSMLPYLLGWQTFANSLKPEDISRPNIANPRPGPDFEWSR
ncbi:Single-stranded DNA-binding protein why1, chloroplastic [Sarracenia purpurea var. burkii]